MNPTSSERALLNTVAERYDSEKDFDHYYSEFGAELVLQEFQGRRLLEVGCASGVMTRKFHGRVPELHVLDGSDKYISILRRDLGDRVVCHVSLAEEFVPQVKYDGVVLASILEHVEAPVELLRRVRTWLAPGGQVFAIVPNANSLHRQVGVAMGMLATTQSFSERDHMLGHRRIYNLGLLRTHLEQAGYSLEQCHGIMIKVVSNIQMRDWPEALIRGLFTVGLPMPEFAAQVYARCRPATERSEP